MKILLISLLLFVSNIAIAHEYKYVGIVGDTIVLNDGEGSIFTKMNETLPDSELKVIDITRNGTQISLKLSDGSILDTYKPTLKVYRPKPIPLNKSQVKSFLRGVHKKKAKETNEQSLEIHRNSTKKQKDEGSSEANEANDEEIYNAWWK